MARRRKESPMWTPCFQNLPLELWDNEHGLQRVRHDLTNTHTVKVTPLPASTFSGTFKEEALPCLPATESFTIKGYGKKSWLPLHHSNPFASQEIMEIADGKIIGSYWLKWVLVTCSWSFFRLVQIPVILWEGITVFSSVWKKSHRSPLNRAMPSRQLPCQACWWGWNKNEKLGDTHTKWHVPFLGWNKAVKMYIKYQCGRKTREDILSGWQDAKGSIFWVSL